MVKLFQWLSRHLPRFNDPEPRGLAETALVSMAQSPSASVQRGDSNTSPSSGSGFNVSAAICLGSTPAPQAGFTLSAGFNGSVAICLGSTPRGRRCLALVPGACFLREEAGCPYCSPSLSSCQASDQPFLRLPSTGFSCERRCL